MCGHAAAASKSHCALAGEGHGRHRWLMPRRPRPAYRFRRGGTARTRSASRASVAHGRRSLAPASPRRSGLAPRYLGTRAPCGGTGCCCGRGEKRDESWWYPYESTRERASERSQRSAGTPDRQRKKAVVTLLLHCSNVKQWQWQTGSTVCCRHGSSAPVLTPDGTVLGSTLV
jgi:hypothetical protein